MQTATEIAAHCACVIILCLTCCQSAKLLRYSWSYDDMASECKPWMSVQVQIENETNLHNVSFTLSTSSLIQDKVYVHTSRRNFTARNRVPCLYHGSNVNTGDSVFASEIRGILKMTFKYKGSWYRTVQPMNSSEPAIAQKFELDEEGLNHCYYKIPPRELNELKLNDSNHKVSSDPVGRRKRSLTLQSFQDAAPKKVLELVIVLDRSFVNKAGSEGSAVTRVMQITNYVNGVYQKFSLRVVLTNIIIWPSDAFTITTSPDDTLNSFTVYKTMRVNVRYDTVILLSAVQWNSGTTLGLAWMNSLCDRLFAAGIVADKYPEAISTAWTLAHEIGHNLGFSHVEDVSGCTCSKTGGCIMNAYLSPTYRLQVLDWSTCSVNAWNSQVNERWRSCLADAPDTSYYSSRSPMCGNGILESGEQCDCGPAETCSSTCCEASTCRFKSGAVCASGPCCDWNSCTLRLKGDECRSASGPCDVPETCSGTSEWCPSDDKVADGVECATGQSYCYNGQCKTTDAQCQAVVSTDATTASSICFSSLNTRGDVFGHCDMQLQSVKYVSTGFNRTYSFASCSTANTGCGLLQCYQSTAPSSGSKVTIGSTVCYSQPRMDFSSSGLRSPSFVPDGAKCGSSAMCINSTCTPLASVRNCTTCPNCNGNGVLTSGSVCFCSSGFAPPTCATAGCGGSVTSPLACSTSGETPIGSTVTASTVQSAVSAMITESTMASTVYGATTASNAAGTTFRSSIPTSDVANTTAGSTASTGISTVMPAGSTESTEISTVMLTGTITSARSTAPQETITAGSTAPTETSTAASAANPETISTAGSTASHGIIATAGSTASPETITATAGSTASFATITATAGSTASFTTITATAGSTASPGTITTTAGSTASPSTSGSTATPLTAGSTATPSTAGSTASPSTAGSTATPSTAGSTATPSTAGSTATPSTAGSTATPSTAGSTASPGTITTTAGPTASPGTIASVAGPTTSAGTVATAGSTATARTSASAVSTTSTTVSPSSTGIPSCSPASCLHGGTCSNGACFCISSRGGTRCEKKRTQVQCQNRISNKQYVQDYDDIRSFAALELWAVLEQFLRDSFRLSIKAEFSGAIFYLQLQGFSRGSVIAVYTMKFDTPENSSAMSLEDIKSAIDSGIMAYSASNASNITVDSNSTIAAHNYCLDTPSPCSQFANCTLVSSSYACTCRTDYRDDDTSAAGTKCTEECSTSTMACSGNGICRTNTGARTTCECFSGYSGDSCQVVAMSSAVLAIVIAVPILFVIIVVVMAVAVHIYRKQGRFKRTMFNSLSKLGAGVEGQVGTAPEQFGAIAPSSAGWLNNSIQIPRARLAGPEFASEHRPERAQQSGLSSSSDSAEQPTRFSYPYKRYSDSTFRSASGAAVSVKH